MDVCDACDGNKQKSVAEKDGKNEKKDDNEVAWKVHWTKMNTVMKLVEKITERLVQKSRVISRGGRA